MPNLVEQWDAIVAAQPSDWSSLFLELRLRDAVQSEECALVMSPLNPWHEEDWRSGVFHFRAAHTYGYGAAAQLVRKRLGTLDDVGIIATLKLERRLSDVRPVAAGALEAQAARPRRVRPWPSGHADAPCLLRAARRPGVRLPEGIGHRPPPAREGDGADPPALRSTPARSRGLRSR